MSEASTALKAAQAPLKEGYASDPASAKVTLKSTSTIDESSNGISCKLSVGKAIREAGLHKMAGGDHEGLDQLCSGDMLLESLVACTGVTLKAVATSMQIPLKSATITAEGDLDFRGTLGVDRSAKVGFEAIRVKFDLDCGDEDRAKVEKLIQLTERYCVVMQTLNNGVKCESVLV